MAPGAFGNTAVLQSDSSALLSPAIGDTGLLLSWREDVGMAGEKLYNELAEHYERIDGRESEDIEADVRAVTEIAKQFKQTDNDQLLDIGCGTGQHLRYLETVYSCVGVDANYGVLERARETTATVTFREQKMSELDIEDTFGIVTCLYNTIGYARSEANLRQAIERMYDHTAAGGVVVIEPYLSPVEYKLQEGEPRMRTYDGDSVKIARQQIVTSDGQTAVLNLHYMIAERGADMVEYLDDTHQLGLFEDSKILGLMEAVGFDTVEHLEDQFSDGAIVGVR